MSTAAMSAGISPMAGVFVLGGAKISDAFLMMKTVLERGVADQILTGGLVSNIFLAALGKETGQGSLDFIINLLKAAQAGLVPMGGGEGIAHVQVRQGRQLFYQEGFGLLPMGQAELHFKKGLLLRHKADIVL